MTEKPICVIRIHGRVDVKPKLRDTLDKLRLRRKFVCVVLPNKKEIVNMVKKVEYYVTWGEIDKDTFKKLLKKRGRLTGNKRINEEFIKKNNFKSFDEMADYIYEDPLRRLKELGIKPFFRLRPPRGGFERGGIKKHFKEGGALGYRGEKINELIEKML